MATRKYKFKHIAASASTHVGDAGELILDTSTNTLKVSDGSTPGGVTLTTDGTGGGGSTGDIGFSGNRITTSSSNANLELDANGTGSVIIQSIEINGNRISATDSTRIRFTDSIEVSGIDFTDEGHGIGGSADPNQISYSAGGGTGKHVFQGDVERMSGATLSTISDPDGSGTAAMIDTANGRNLVIHAGNGSDFNYSTLYLRGTKIELGEGTGQISIQENNITTTRSNDNLVLDANGTGKITTIAQLQPYRFLVPRFANESAANSAYGTKVGGELIYTTGDNQLRVWNGSVWSSVM